MADLICRWRNPYIKTIVELVRVLPHKVMPSNEYRTIVENRWPGFLRTAYQLACQVGLYYESDDGFYYPRFDHDIDEGEAYTYMQRWIRRYYVPNPYTKSMRTLQQPKPFLASIIEYIYEHPDEKELHSILENVFQEDIGNIDIISNVLNTYTDLMKVDDNGNVELTEKAKDFMNKFIDRNDKKAFFDNFSEEAIETTQEELLRQSSAAKFLREALTLVIGEDANLSKLAALNRYRETNKQLKINGFNLWRKKDDLPFRLEDVYQDIEIEYNGQKYVMYLEWTPADMESLFFPVFNNAYSGIFAMCKEGNDYVLYKVSQSNGGGKGEPLQQIFYGAPGTGKSYEINRITKGKEVIRTTFHPDSDYSTFLGCYKPTMRPVADKYKAVAGKDEDIAYEFVPQAFLKAYTSAWKNQEKPFYLIIEEINRGNCAQIFGDLFQLLDRNKNGYSDYPISPDEDIQKFLKTDKKYGFAELTEVQKNSIPAKIQSGDEMCLPNNLHIWATMNTSDQSLFPIDSAFKRRWDWKYMPIDTKKERWSITVEGVNYSWTSFLDVVNKRIYGATMSEDKQLGFYFCKAQDNVVCAKTFVSKVLFYLWNDVFKDYDESESIFKDSNGAKLSFSDFYKSNGDIDESTVTKLLVALEVSKEGVSDNVDYDNDLTLDEEDAEESEGKDYTRYTINGQGEYPKRQLSTQAVRKYIEIHPELTAEQVVANWMTLGNIVSHFIETKEQFDARTDISKRSNEVPCGNSMIYVAWNGWGSQDKMQTLINAVNNKDWGIKLAIKE